MDDNNIILGIDPGSRITGYGLIEYKNRKLVYLSSGIIDLKSLSFSESLQQIFLGVSEIISTYKPTTAAIEQVFVHANPGAALKLGQARGAAIVAMSNHNLPIAEYSARQIKQSVVGYGNAEKDQVKKMVKIILSLDKEPRADAADGLACAIRHAQCSQGNKVIGSGRFAKGRRK